MLHGVCGAAAGSNIITEKIWRTSESVVRMTRYIDDTAVHVTTRADDGPREAGRKDRPRESQGEQSKGARAQGRDSNLQGRRATKRVQQRAEKNEVRESHVTSRRGWSMADHEKGFQLVRSRAEAIEATDGIESAVRQGEPVVRTDVSERRRRGNQRPMFEFQRAWPAAKATGVKGQDEFPMATPSASMQDVAWGCMHNTMHEHADEAELRPMELHNVPPTRPKQGPAAAQQAYTSQEHPDGWHPESIQELFQEFVFTAAKHGKWITRFAFKRRQITADAETGGQAATAGQGRLTDTTEIRMSPGEIVAMLEAWVATNAEDVRAAEKAETDGSQPYTFRARAATLIVPEEAFTPMARRRVYDTSEWYKAPVADRHGGLIKLVDVGTKRQQHCGWRNCENGQ